MKGDVFELIGEPHAVDHACGVPISRHLVFPRICKDGSNERSALLVRNHGGDVLKLIVPDSERAAVEHLGWDAKRVVYYGNYFTWDAGSRPTQDRFDSRAAAVASVVDGAPLHVDHRIPAVVFCGLRDRLRAVPTGSAEPTESTTVFRLPASRVEEERRSGRKEAVRAAELVVQALSQADRLRPFLSLEDPGFDLLERMVGEAGLNALLVTSPFNVEELTALPEALVEAQQIAAAYIAGDRHVYLLIRGDWAPRGGEHVGTFSSTEAAIRAMGGEGRVGIEEVHLPTGSFVALEDLGVQPTDATLLLRRWQDRRAGAYLPYFILAANATKFAIDSALAHAESALKQGQVVDEAGLANMYDSFVGQFACDVGLPGRIRPYFHVVHTGRRTAFPSLPTHEVFSTDTATVKMDMGVLALDDRGRVRGCSDIARTMTGVPHLAELIAELQLVIKNDVIPSARAGMPAESLHEVAVAALGRLDTTLLTLGPSQGKARPSDYSRDCGHTLNRQSIASVRFAPGHPELLEEHMVGCAEIVWPSTGQAIAVEESFFVAAGGALAITY